MTPATIEAGYVWAYHEFYRWSSIARAARSHESLKHQVKHFGYAAGWKKFEAAWNVVIRARQLRYMTPVLEAVLSKVTRAEGACPLPGIRDAGSDRVTEIAPARIPDPGSRMPAV